MDPLTIGIGAFVVLLIMLACRIPVGFALIAVSFVGIWLLRSFKVAWLQLGSVPHEFSASWTLSAIPMFILMGAFAHHSGMTHRLYVAARIWLSKVPGGLAVATTAACAGFAAASGSSLAMAAAMTKISVPEMLKSGYHPGLATATVACGGTIGALIPPSLLFILYGWYTETSISKLFMAGVFPGILTAGAYIVMIITRVKVNPSLAPALREQAQYTWGERFKSLTDILPMGILIIVVMSGLYTGVTTATEAGAFGAFGALLIAIAMRQLTIKQFWGSQLDTARSLAQILFIVIGAVMLTRFLALAGLGRAITDLIISISGGGQASVFVVLAFTIITYLILGMFLDPLGIMLITLPILMPLFKAANMDMLWVGVISVKLLEMGLLTPPVGLNVYMVKATVGDAVPIGVIFKGVAWFFIADIGVLGLIIFFPEIATWLPSRM